MIIWRGTYPVDKVCYGAVSVDVVASLKLSGGIGQRRNDGAVGQPCQAQEEVRKDEHGDGGAG